MNVGYSRNMSTLHKNPVCPLCGGNVYGSKRGIDFTCVNEECALNKTSADTLAEALKQTLKDL